MNAKQLRDLDDKELAKQLAELRKEILGLTGELDDTAGLKRAKHDLARVLTIARERELVAGTSSGMTRARTDRHG
ncbi:MAG: 50S ribosomal protein L29 [Actinobacteria bacterium]|nr:MAG: 50S ribosomal protein L29 [Actinomycetota bacterium]